MKLLGIVEEAVSKDLDILLMDRNGGLRFTEEPSCSSQLFNVVN